MTHGSGKHVLVSFLQILTKNVIKNFQFQCILCDFKCSNQKAGRKHLKKVHDVDKDQTPLRQYLHIKTPEEDGIVFPSVEAPIKQEIIDVDEEPEDDDDFDDETDDENSNESNLMGSLLQPEVIIGTQ